ncbi:MAG: hypothetical protein NXH75_18135, partial [Halobacteriovoraceae bacterium]|nr:hypothetical protein [Halobacteriovoraceae bacterium]
MLIFVKSIHFRDVRRLSILLTSLVILFTPVKTNAQESSALSPIVEAIAKLLEGITNVNIESATLGIDKGIIAGAVLGIGRTVERNPFPTGLHDQFL